MTPRSSITPQLDAVIRDHAVELRATLSAVGDPTVVSFNGDPRPDLTDAALLWGRLLALSWARDSGDRCGVHGSLLGMRCLGVRLVAGSGALRLEARTDSPGDPPAWVTPAQYHDERRRWLDPNREAVVSLFVSAARSPRTSA